MLKPPLPKLPRSAANVLKKLGLVTACLALVIGLAMWTRRNILRFEEETVRKTNQYMLGAAKEKSQCIEEFVREIQDYLALLSRKPFSGEFRKREPLPYNDYVAGKALFDHIGGRVDMICKIDRDGIVLDTVPFERKNVGMDFSGKPGIRDALEKREQYVSEVFPIQPGVLGFSVCQPVFRNEQFIGLVCAMISLETLSRSACRIQEGGTGSTWIIDKEGLIISHANPELVGKNILMVRRDAVPDFDWSEFAAVVQRMISGEEGFGIYHSARPAGKQPKAGKQVAVFLPVNLRDREWSIACVMDYAEIAEPIQRNTVHNFLAAGFLMVMFGAGGSIYYKTRKRKAELEAISRNAEELRLSNENLRLEIEQRIEAENARRESESNYRLLAENVTDIIWIADLELRFTYISPSVSRVLGYEACEAVGKKMEALLTVTSSETAQKMLAEELELENRPDTNKQRSRTLDLELRRKDDSTIWAETKVSLLHGSDGKPTGILGVARDITEKLQLQQQLFQAQKMESIGTLAGGIAHDFNNLLGGILGYASLIKTKLSRNHHTFDYAETIEKSASRAAELTAQLLAFARGGKYEATVLNLNTIVGETLEIVTRTFEKSIEIRACLAESLPTVEADPAQLQQVLMNLCVNARDAMPNGGKLTVETRVETVSAADAKAYPAARPGSYVTLSVTDTGCGMDKETEKRIFEPFFTTKEKGKGTGLGLSMVYGVVKNHGGYVRIFTEPGVGSTFKIFVPVSGKKLTRDTKPKDQPQGGSETVLVVDDEEVIRSLTKDTLESHGYRVLLAEHGLEAIGRYREQNEAIGLVIIDMVMPKMGGRETFLKLKEIDPKVKAILATGYSQDGEANEILDSGVMGFIHKPFQLDELLSKVRAVLDSEEATQQSLSRQNKNISRGRKAGRSSGKKRTDDQN